MEAPEVIEIIRDGIYVLILMAAPLMATALIVGLVVSLIQALTQIQEATLSFVPKVLSMVLILVLTLPFMITTLIEYNNKLYEKIVHIE